MGSCFTREIDVDFDGPGTLVVLWPGNRGSEWGLGSSERSWWNENALSCIMVYGCFWLMCTPNCK